MQGLSAWQVHGSNRLSCLRNWSSDRRLPTKVTLRQPVIRVRLGVVCDFDVARLRVRSAGHYSLVLSRVLTLAFVGP